MPKSGRPRGGPSPSRTGCLPMSGDWIAKLFACLCALPIFGTELSQATLQYASGNPESPVRNTRHSKHKCHTYFRAGPPPPAVDDSRQPRLERKPKPKGRKSGRRNPEFSRICVCLESRGPVEKRSVGTPAVGPCAGSLEMQHGVLDWVSRHLHKEFRLPKVLLRSPTRPTHRASMHGISFIGAFL